MQELLSKLEHLRSNLKADRDLQQLSAWEEQIRAAMAADEIRDHVLIKELIAKWTLVVQSVETALKRDRTMTELERLNLMDKRDLYNSFLSMFDNKDRMKDIEKEIDQSVDHLKKIYAV